MRTLQRIGGLPPFRAAAALVLALGYFAHSVSAAYFYVQESQDKCFIESVPTGVALTASYKNHENPGVTCSIIFKDPSGRSVYSREVLPADAEGKVTHMTTTTGEYQVCISCASSKWFNTQLLKWSLSIELGDTDINIDDLAKKEHVNSVHLKLQAIARRLEAMQAENDYERVQEERFQRTSEAINSRVVWFSVLQLLLLWLFPKYLVDWFSLSVYWKWLAVDPNVTGAATALATA
ncbi:emp24/gp25L/p24 family domain-containing, transmembrane protein, putative [Eimeria tenella]|uniref:Emp24/gp25L/p24 family domain-containing, transmembrane protein, putative n=1 Tax=Eimeria tenella TaxID=5802 RepID=U6KU29_EIMTE|nr:emp24/gp25L/p24 family domain-containing, transmembrane protein, putative [Eimeria tenella]CDJ41441.1 emp24/gp25L/p24 family domain-containing, transmembrane protein, putative [Eimeria tenella]|eukprot:XP_013232191.1 emp24/gp25L/p24 family domain-containing, transmembrane protein, putative [Eimeria tenella]